MTKFVLRRILQSIPTLIGITIIAYFIMDLVPGNPLSAVTMDQNITPEQRQAIFEANGFNDPFLVKYFRWLIGDAPIAFNEDPAWAVALNNKTTVIIDAESGEVVETRPTVEMNQDVSDEPVNRGLSGEQATTANAAETIALEAIPVEETEIVDLQWISHYLQTSVWAVEFNDEQTLLIDSTSGEIITTIATQTLLDSPLYAPQPETEGVGVAEIQLADANQTALQIARDAIRVNTANWIEDYNGSSAWAISVNTGTAYIIDDSSGEVLASLPTTELRASDDYTLVNSDFGSNAEFLIEDAQQTALDVAVQSLEITATQWVPNYSLVSAWRVDLNNGDTIIIDSATEQILQFLPTAEFDGSAYEYVSADEVSGISVSANKAEDIALDLVPTTTVGFLPFYQATVLWQGRKVPFTESGVIVGYQTGTALGVLRGDFGQSVVSKRPTTESIGLRIGATFELGIISLAVGLVIGIPVGVLAAVWQGSIFDQITRIGAVLVSSIPVFWLGLILLLIFGSWLHWLPMGNRFPVDSFSVDYSIGERIRHLILPVFTLSSFTIATFSRFMRASLLNVLNEDYVRTARAKGLSDRKVWFKHALRNAMIPIATILGPSLTGVLSGAVLTETIYSWPGMGKLVVDSVTQQDYPVIMGIVLLFAVLTIVGYLISDILYAVVDPRIRLG